MRPNSTFDNSTTVKRWEANSLSEMLTLSNRIEYSNVQYYFRGHANPSWNLKNTLHRLKDYRQKRGLTEPNEVELIKQFMATLPSKCKSKSLFEIIATMQHIGLPTRMLDFTTAFWTAVFFATTPECYNEKRDRFDSIIYMINPEVVTNEPPIINLNELEKFSIPQEYNISYPLYKFEPENKTKRIKQQRGTFLFMHDPFENIEERLSIENNWESIQTEVIISDPHEQFLRSTSIHKITTNFDKIEYRNVRKYLNENQYNYQTLFADLEGKSLQIKHGIF